MKRADHELAQRVLDGEVSREEFDAFQQRMRDEPDLVRLYEDYALLHHTLHEEFERGHSGGDAPAESARRIPGLSGLLVIAVVLALGAAAWRFRPWSVSAPAEDVAVATFSVDAVWRIEGARRNLGAATGLAGGSVLHLLQGRAAITLEPSVNTVVEGPAELTFHSKDSLHLSYGRGYFRRGGSGEGLTVTTPRLTARDSGTEFGIEVPPDGPDELHVRAGHVRIASNHSGESVDLVSGVAARVPSAGPIVRFPSDGRTFAKGLGRFRSVVSGPFETAQWRLGFGNPSISGQHIEGANFSAFLRLPEPEPGDGDTILLATLETGKSSAGEFHTDGWAGMSFFSGSTEVLFFGDSFGTRPTWSLDVKQRLPVIFPDHPVTGPRTVTLRYDRLSGAVSLHDGKVPLSPPFCSGKLPPGTRFDEIRIGASAGAALKVNSLQIRTGGE